MTDYCEECRAVTYDNEKICEDCTAMEWILIRTTIGVITVIACGILAYVSA